MHRSCLLPVATRARRPSVADSPSLPRPPLWASPRARLTEAADKKRGRAHAAPTMGQSLRKPMLCCVHKDDKADFHPSASPSEHIQGLQQGIDSLHKVVDELQGEMARLRSENGQLRQAQSSLSSENSTLARTMEEQDSERLWSTFDILENHYRELELHRAHIARGEVEVAPVEADGSAVEAEEADEAAGAPSTLPGSPSRLEDHGGAGSSALVGKAHSEMDTHRSCGS